MSKNRFNFEQKDRSCTTWETSKSGDHGIIDQYNAEAFVIGGVEFNVFKLLGVHEQGKLVDLTGEGIPMSGGTSKGFSERNAFDSEECKPWRSKQQGVASILADSFIGYDFGVPKLDNGRNKYGVEVNNSEHITTIKIAQSDDPNRRVTKARVERSVDRKQWLGSAIVDLPNDSETNTVAIRQTALARYWRLRPLEFTGTDSDFWEVKTLELIDYDQTNLYQVQDDYGWIENRDRDYAKKPIEIKGYYDLLEKESELTQFGFGISGGVYYITTNFNDLVHRIGRPIVIGDILEIPSEAMYNPDMAKILKYIEVTDVSWSAEGYTPGWQPTMLRILAEPMLAKQETMDIVGDMAGSVDSSGLFEVDESKYSEMGLKMSDVQRQKALDEVPQDGSDSTEFTSFDDETIDKYQDAGIEISKISVNQKGLYTEDGLPKNGEDFSRGSEFPDKASDGDYHRVEYAGMADDVPARLYRYSAKKGRWMFVEKDLRKVYQDRKPNVNKYANSVDSIPMRDVGKAQK